MNIETRISTRAHPWIFLGLTLGLSWTFWILVAVLGASIPRWSVTMLHYLGGLMPLVVGVGLICLRHDRPFQRDFWRRVIDFRRIGAGWYAVIFLCVPVNSGLAALVDLLLGGSGIQPEALADLAQRPLMIVPTLLFWLLFGPVPEELGWRGYALDGLQARVRLTLDAILIEHRF